MCSLSPIEKKNCCIFFFLFGYILCLDSQDTTNALCMGTLLRSSVGGFIEKENQNTEHFYIILHINHVNKYKTHVIFVFFNYCEIELDFSEFELKNK